MTIVEIEGVEVLLIVVIEMTKYAESVIDPMTADLDLSLPLDQDRVQDLMTEGDQDQILEEERVAEMIEIAHAVENAIVRKKKEMKRNESQSTNMIRKKPQNHPK